MNEYIKRIKGKLFPLTKTERKVVRFIYGHIAKHGKFPAESVGRSFMGFSEESFKWEHAIRRLRKRGWVKRQPGGGYVMAGVGLTFTYPATLFLKNQMPLAQVDNIRQVQGEPETLERLINLASGAIGLGYHADDALTVKWAADLLLQLIEAGKKLLSDAAPCGLSRNFIVRGVDLTELVGMLPKRLAAPDDFAIHS